jgi:hypothetical protein
VEESGYIVGGNSPRKIKIIGEKSPSPPREVLQQVEKHLAKLTRNKETIEKLIKEVPPENGANLQYKLQNVEKGNQTVHQ